VPGWQWPDANRWCIETTCRVCGWWPTPRPLDFSVTGAVANHPVARHQPRGHVAGVGDGDGKPKTPCSGADCSGWYLGITSQENWYWHAW
jgi:hypothetical protein